MSAKFGWFLSKNRVTQAAIARVVELDPAQINRCIRHGQRLSSLQRARVIGYLSAILERVVTEEEVFGPAEAEPALVGRDSEVSA